MFASKKINDTHTAMVTMDKLYNKCYRVQCVTFGILPNGKIIRHPAKLYVATSLNDARKTAQWALFFAAGGEL